MLRLFAKSQDISGGRIKLSAEDSEHIRSLRLRPDELFVICDGEGADYVCRLGARYDGTAAGTEGSFADIVLKRQSLGEPSIACTVYIAYSKGESLDYAVQKSVELGAHGIVLYKANRCVAVPGNVQKKTERLQRIALESAKQCGRGLIPVVTDGGNFKTAVDLSTQRSALSLLFYEGEDYLHIKEVLEQNFSSFREREEYKISTISVITGPEGGFEPAEVELAKSKGICAVSLGSRILRAETAPVVALSAIMFHTGNL